MRSNASSHLFGRHRVAFVLAAATYLAGVGMAEFVPQKDATMPTLAVRVPVPPLAPPEGAISVIFDCHGNYWALAPAEKNRRQVVVLPAQDQKAWGPDKLSGIEPGGWRWLVTDESGCIWISDGHRVMRLDHARGSSEPSVPFMHEFLRFVWPDRRTILRKRRWP